MTLEFQHTYKHFQDCGHPAEGADDFQSPTQPARYISLRIQPIVELYQRRIPKYTLRNLVLKVMVLMLGVAASDQSALDARYSQVDGSGAIIGIDHASAQLEQSSINTKLVAGWASLGGGVALAVVGAILMARQPTPSAHPRATLGASPTAAVSIWPSGKGLCLSLQF